MNQQADINIGSLWCEIGSRTCDETCAYCMHDPFEFTQWREYLTKCAPKQNVLDINSGNGMISQTTLELGHRVTTTDSLSLADHPFMSNSFDLLTARHVLPHLDDPVDTFMEWNAFFDSVALPSLIIIRCSYIACIKAIITLMLKSVCLFVVGKLHPK